MFIQTLINLWPMRNMFQVKEIKIMLQYEQITLLSF